MEEKLEAKVLKNPAEVAKHILKSTDHNEQIKSIWRILENSKDKKLKKACKKVIYILRSNGIDVDALKPGDEAGFGTKDEKEIRTEDDFKKELYRSFLYIPDSLGNSRLIIVIYNEGQANYEMFDIIYNMEDGIKHVRVEKASKSMVKKIIDNEQELVEVAPAYALSRLNDVINSTNTQDKVPDKIKKFSKGIGTAIHPILLIYPASISGIVSTEEEKELFSRPEIARLVIPDKYTSSYKKEVLQAQNSILIINNMTPQERIDQTLSRFVSYYFIPQRLAMYRTLLLDIALYLHSIGEKILAKRLVNYAEELIKPMSDINSHPLVRMLVYKSFFMN